jgi:hypothetical protein
VTPEGTRDGRLSADGTLLLARDGEGKYFIYPIAGGEPRPVPGLTDTDVLAQWSADGRSVLVYRRAEIPCRLERVDLVTGRRTLFKEFAPADRTGLLSMREMVVTDDLGSTPTPRTTRSQACLYRKAGDDGCAPDLNEVLQLVLLHQMAKRPVGDAKHVGGSDLDSVGLP